MNSERKGNQTAELRNMLHDQMEEEMENNETHSHSNMDVLHLPPRKEVHANTGRVKLKINKSFIRFLFVLLLLTIMVIGAYYYIGDEFIFNH